MYMTFRVWFEDCNLGCHGRGLLVGRYVCIGDFSHLGMIGIMSNLGNMDRNSCSNLINSDRKLSNRCH